MTNYDTRIVIDTHILLWSIIEKTKLNNTEIQLITEAQRNNSLIISSISLWEITMLAHKKKISIFGRVVDFLEDIEKIPGIYIAEINGKTSSESIMLNNFHGDPADRLIVATTKVFSARLLTRDQKIINWAQQSKSISCN